MRTSSRASDSWVAVPEDGVIQGMGFIAPALAMKHQPEGPSPILFYPEI